MNIIIRIILMGFCWGAIFFALEIYTMRGGFLHQALCAIAIYFGATGLLKLHESKP